MEYLSNRFPSSMPLYKEAGPSSLPTNINHQMHEHNSPQESLSSLSVESLETEQQLLEQCISSGMPKSAPQSSSTILLQQAKEQILADSKNVNAASVARITKMCPKAITTVTGVDYAKLEEDEKIESQQLENAADGAILIKGAPVTDTSTDLTRNGFNEQVRVNRVYLNRSSKQFVLGTPLRRR